MYCHNYLIKAKVESRDKLQILSMDGNELKSHTMPEQVLSLFA